MARKRNAAVNKATSHPHVANGVTDDVRVKRLLDLEPGAARQAWVRTHLPEKDEKVVQALRQEANRVKRDDPRLALYIAEILADLAAVWNSPSVLAESLYVQAAAYRNLGEYETALPFFEKAVDLYRRLGTPAEAARVSVGYIGALLDLGRYSEALHYSEWAAAQLEAAGDRHTLAKVLSNRGNVLARLGRFEEARACYARARELFEAVGDRRRLMVVNVNDANVQAEMNDFRQAEALLQEAQAYFAGREASLAAQIDLNLGYLYFAQGDYQKALHVFHRARTVFLRHGLPVEVAYADLHSSDCYLALNLWHEALELARRARATFEARHMVWEAGRLWLNEAVALAHLNAASEALRAVDRAAAHFAEVGSELWLAAVDLFRAAFSWHYGDLDGARRRALSALDRFKRARVVGRVAECENLLGEMALFEGNLDRAADHFRRALSVLQAAPGLPVAYRSYFGLGQVAHLRGDRQGARQAYRQAVALVERLYGGIGAEDYKMAFLQDKLQVYDALVRLCLEEETPEAMAEAFEGVERAKSRALLDALSRLSTEEAAGRQKALSTHEQALWQEIDRVKRELNWFYTRLQKAWADGEEQEREPTALLQAVAERERQLAELLRAWRAPDLVASPRNPVWTVNVSDVQQILPEKALLLEFYVTGCDRLVAFGVTRQGVSVRWLPGTATEMAEVLRRLRFQLNKFSYGPAYRERYAGVLWSTVHQELRALHAGLLAPVEDWLQEAETLIIVPHGALHYVPFHALTPEEGKYLVDTHTVAYAPSATVFYHTLVGQARPAGDHPPLVVGVSDHTIPHARTEVEMVGALFPAAEVRFGEAATVEALLEAARRPAFLHLATHAVFRPDNPFFSALKLADGWVRVSDIYEMEGMAPLVTLSACETGRAQVAVGDELVGLCRGFFAAGAQALVVSLWLVDDLSTAHLMRAFYEALAAGQPAAQALRRAQGAVREIYPHPYYWAPFFVTGNPFYRLSTS